VTYFNKKPYASIDAEAGVPHFEKGTNDFDDVSKKQ
jgi:CO dehydrogenase nickel-insertion accessory protein CooC1